MNWKRILNALLLLVMASIVVSPVAGFGYSEYYEPLPEVIYNETGSLSHDASFYVSSGGFQSYTVKKGDTLGAISQKIFGTTKNWRKIAQANGISDPKSLQVGRVLKIPTGSSVRAVGSGATNRDLNRVRESNPALMRSFPPPLRAQTWYDAGSMPTLPLPPVVSGADYQMFSGSGLPKIYLPGGFKRIEGSRNSVTFNGLTGLINTFAAYPLGKGLFSTAMGITWNKITRRNNQRLEHGEDADYWSFPIAMTYSSDNFEVAMQLPFESYDVFAPITYNFRNGEDSGMGDVSLRLKFSSQNDEMASALGIGAIFPTSDRMIGQYESNNAWETFAGISTKRREGGNLHVNVGYQAGDGNTDHEGIFFNVGFDYEASHSFTFIGEINSYSRFNNGRSTDLTLGLRHHVKTGMAVTLAAPIALNNSMFFGYDYMLMGQLQYNY